jgi:hypothetical protein
VAYGAQAWHAAAARAPGGAPTPGTPARTPAHARTGPIDSALLDRPYRSAAAKRGPRPPSVGAHMRCLPPCPRLQPLPLLHAARRALNRPTAGHGTACMPSRRAAGPIGAKVQGAHKVQPTLAALTRLLQPRTSPPPAGPAPTPREALRRALQEHRREGLHRLQHCALRRAAGGFSRPAPGAPSQALGAAARRAGAGRVHAALMCGGSTGSAEGGARQPLHGGGGKIGLRPSFVARGERGGPLWPWPAAPKSGLNW